MADEVEVDVHNFAKAESPGTRLKREREAKKLTTRQIAGKLHMDSWMLDAIERDEFGALGAPVFAKGHLRKYAHELDIDPDDLMVAYYQLAGTRETPPLIAESILRMEAANGLNIGWLLPAAIVFAAIASVAGGAMWYLRSDSAPRPASAAAATQPEDRKEADVSGARSANLVLPTAQADEERVIDPPVQTAAETPAEAPVAAPATHVAAVEAPPVVEQAPPPSRSTSSVDSITLTLRFREESWVEVYDAERNKLLYGMGEADTAQYLSGPPPLQVFLGRYRDVDVEVNGNSYIIPREARRTNTARFRIEDPRSR